MTNPFGVEHGVVSKVQDFEAGDGKHVYTKEGYIPNPNYGKVKKPARKGFLGIGKRPAVVDRQEAKHLVWAKRPVQRKSGKIKYGSSLGVYADNDFKTPYSGKYNPLKSQVSKSSQTAAVKAMRRFKSARELSQRPNTSFLFPKSKVNEAGEYGFNSKNRAASAGVAGLKRRLNIGYNMKVGRFSKPPTDPTLKEGGYVLKAPRNAGYRNRPAKVMHYEGDGVFTVMQGGRQYNVHRSQLTFYKKGKK
jgi:hypothetical protein